MIDDAAAAFLKYHYADVRDLCKHFLTLVSAILVFSLAFAEKVVEYSKANTRVRTSLTFTWTALLLAIVACGIGLCYISLAGGDAVYGGTKYLDLAGLANMWLLAAGGFFVSALVAMIAAAMFSARRRKTDAMPLKDVD